MKYINSKTGWAIAILVLVLINIATLLTFWCSKKRGFNEHQPPPNRGGAATFIIKELALDSLQQIQYLALVQEHQKAIREIKEQVKDAKEAYFGLLADSSAKQETINTAIAKATTIEEQIDIKTFEHFKQVRALCNPEQKKKFDSIILDVFRMMAPDKHQGPPPPRDERGEREGAHHRPPPPDEEGFPPPPPDGNHPPQ